MHARRGCGGARGISCCCEFLPPPSLSTNRLLLHGGGGRSAFQRLDKMRERKYHAPSPAGSRTPVEQQTHKRPRRPRLVIAMRGVLALRNLVGNYWTSLDLACGLK